MKKLYELIKPFIFLVFGVLVILNFLNGLSDGGSVTAKAIIAIVVGAYFIVFGLLETVLGQKDNKLMPLLKSVGFASFGAFFFVSKLLDVIDYNSLFGTNGWIISIYSLVVSVLFVIFVLVGNFTNDSVIKKISWISGLLFLLALLLELLFTLNGDPTLLGIMPILGIIINTLFGYLYLTNNE